MNLFKRINDQIIPIIKNEDFLLPNYIPEDIFSREKEINEISLNLLPLTKNSNARNMLIVGKTGVGKTTTVKYVVRELEAYSNKVKVCYINCWQYSTKFSILSQMAHLLGYAVPRRGVAYDEILSKILEILKQEKTNPVIILDEADKLLKDLDILYDFSRLLDENNIKFGIILITNASDFLVKIDGRIKSSLLLNEIVFKPYKPDVLKMILENRAKKALYFDSVDKEVIGLCAAIGAKRGGDCRIAINCLLSSAKLAEKWGDERLMIKHVQAVKQEVLKRDLKEKQALLPETSKKILKQIEKMGGECTSGELYENIDIEDKTIRNHLKNLEELGFIKTEKINLKRGKTRKIYLELGA